MAGSVDGCVAAVVFLHRGAPLEGPIWCREQGGHAFNQRKQVGGLSRHKAPHLPLESCALAGSFVGLLGCAVGAQRAPPLKVQSTFSSPGGARLAWFNPKPAAINAMLTE